MRHMPNERMKARARPQGRLRHTTGQRFTLRLEYFGFLFAFAISDLRATCAALSCLPAHERHAEQFQQPLALFVGAGGGDDVHL